MVQGSNLRLCCTAYITTGKATREQQWQIHHHKRLAEAMCFTAGIRNSVPLLACLLLESRCAAVLGGGKILSAFYLPKQCYRVMISLKFSHLNLGFLASRETAGLICSSMVSLWSLAVVAFERYLVICKPLGNFTFRGTHAIIGCAVTWMFGLAASLPPLFGWSRYIPEGLQCSCGPDWYTTENKWNNESYVIFLFCFCFGVPLSVIIFSYGRLLLTLRAVAKQQEQSATTQKAEREVTKMVVVMVMGFLVCWLPYASFALWVVTHRGEPFDVRLASIPSVFSKASTVYNPVIYVLMNKQFRSCMLKLIFCGKSPFGDEDDVSGSSQATQVSSVSSSQVSPA
ncbi:blue-sensitive opsin isoform X1 [Anolis carolinensis]|uniref:blue-sensitive opsin isoform X1 n=1 Tax=Anolis carolinensis TaxID=28377 RepID=UPI002F2B465F